MTWDVDCPICGHTMKGPDVEKENIEDPETPIVKARYAFGGEVSTVTEARAKRLKFECGHTVIAVSQ